MVEWCVWSRRHRVVIVRMKIVALIVRDGWECSMGLLMVID